MVYFHKNKLDVGISLRNPPFKPNNKKNLAVSPPGDSSESSEKTEEAKKDDKARREEPMGKI